MALQSIRTYNFRNLQNSETNTDARQVFLIGENGQGKTNFLESIYYVCYGSSFRTRRDDVLRKSGEAEMAVEANYFRDDNHQVITIKQTGRKKEFSLDGVEVRERKDIVDTIPCVVFCHDDIQFVTGGPEMQRWLINQTISLVDQGFIESLRRYSRLLKMRNAALKDQRLDLLDVLDLQLAEAGLPLIIQREKMSVTLDRTMAHLFAMVFELTEELRVDYRSSWLAMDTAGIVEHLGSRRSHDIDMRTTTSGPHRDRFPLTLGGRLVQEIASTGQLRLMSLLLRVAQAQLLTTERKREPLLLLDDVLLELDPTRRARFMEALPPYDQAFFTFLPDEKYLRLEDSENLSYHVTDGAMSAQSR